MKIENEVKSSSFSSHLHKAVVNIIFTSHWIETCQSPIFKEHDLLPQHFNVLRIVNGRAPEPISPGEILESMIDKKRDLTRLVDKLVSMDLLERQTNPQNRRSVLISITKKGQKLQEKINQELQNWITDLHKLSEVEAKELSRLLDKLRG